MKNVSSIPGDEVAQLYLVFPKIPGAPLRALRGIERVNIPAGQTRHVRFTLNPRDLSCVSEEGEIRVAPGAYKVFVGGGQPNTKAPGKASRPHYSGRTEAAAVRINPQQAGRSSDRGMAP